MPGVSRSSTFLLRRIHCLPLVTPGLFPVLVHALPVKLFINVDFPTLGIPATNALTGLLSIPLRLSLSIFSWHAFCIILFIALTPVLSFELVLATK